MLLWTFVALVGMTNVQLIAANDSQSDSASNTGILAYEENIMLPEVSDEDNIEYLQEYQLSQAKSLVKKGFDVELMRNREVIVIIVEAEKLFAQNDNVLTDKGKRELTPILDYIADSNMYKVVLAMYADNTGSEYYRLSLSEERAESVQYWFCSQSPNENIVAYGLGGENPLYPNNSVKNRAKNRRLEILLIPNEGLIKQANE